MAEQLRLLHDQLPATLDAALWAAALRLPGIDSRAVLEVGVAWEITPSPFAEVAAFYREEGTAFPTLPLASLDWSLEAEEAWSATFRVGPQRCEAMAESARELTSPWLNLCVVTSSESPDRAFVGSLARALSAKSDDAIGKVLDRVQRVPLFGDLLVAAACETANTERSAILERVQGQWTVSEWIRS